MMIQMSSVFNLQLIFIILVPDIFFPSFET